MVRPLDSIRTALASIPRKHHAVLPTPIHELRALSAETGVRVFCKRDDLSGFGYGGNKARKLDFLIAEALEQSCDTLIAVGANQSNFCRMAAAYGSANDIDVHLILGGREPSSPSGNLLLGRMLGATTHHVDSNEWDDWAAAAQQLEERLVNAGRSVYRMPVGGSTSTGAIGYVAAMDEILEDESNLGVRFDAIIHASSSAGTQAGLVVGKALTDWPGRIYGISVAHEAGDLRTSVRDLARETAARLGMRVDENTILTDDAFVGAEYGAKTPESQEAIRYFAQRCGIFLDNVYTGKAAAGLLSSLREGLFPPGSSVLFLHTGGSPELLA